MTNVANGRILKYGFLFLCVAVSIILFIDAYLALYNKSICPTDACKLVETYVNVPPYVLPLFGGVFFLMLFLLFVIHLKNKGIYENLIWLIFFGALSFDGVLVGYLFKTKVFCLLCIGVALCLIVSFICFSLITKRYNNILMGLIIWIFSFVSLNILNLHSSDKRPPKLEESAMIHIPSKSTPKFHADLFVSLRCIHCLNVLYNLGQKDFYNDIEWNIHFVGGSEDDYIRVAHILKDPKLKKIPFRVIVKYKIEKNLDQIPVDKNIKEKFKKANAYFRYMGYKGIPLLKIKYDIYDTTILGDKNIAKFLMEKNILDKWYFFK